MVPNPVSSHFGMSSVTFIPKISTGSELTLSCQLGGFLFELIYFTELSKYQDPVSRPPGVNLLPDVKVLASLLMSQDRSIFLWYLNVTYSVFVSLVLMSAETHLIFTFKGTLPHKSELLSQKLSASNFKAVFLLGQLQQSMMYDWTDWQRPTHAVKQLISYSSLSVFINSV